MNNHLNYCLQNSTIILTDINEFDGERSLYEQKNLPFTLKDFYDKVFYMDYQRSGYRNEHVERKQWPSFNRAFYSFIYDYLTIPTFNQFVNLYMQGITKPLEEDVEKGLVGRLSRTYPAFMREVQVLLYLQKKGWNAKYSTYDDLNGVDVSIDLGKVELGLRMHSGSQTAKDYATYKENFRQNYKGRMTEEFGMEHWFCIGDNDLRLHSKRDINRLLGMIHYYKKLAAN